MMMLVVKNEVIRSHKYPWNALCKSEIMLKVSFLET